MSLKRKLKQARQRRILRVRSRLNKVIPRASVFRSLNRIYVQIIDDAQGKTLASYSCHNIDPKNVKQMDKKGVAFIVGKELAMRARSQGITAVEFDRGPFLCHGRVRAVIDGLREGGLNL